VLPSTVPTAWAQNSWATITGQITDATHAGIPNVKVRAFVPGTHQGAAETVSNATGDYSIPFLAPGTYTVEAIASGFKNLSKTNVVVRAADTVKIPIMLEVGEMSDRVTIDIEGEMLQTSTASRSQRFDADAVRALPTIGRQAYNLISLAPGVLFAQEQFGNSGFDGLRNWDSNGKYAINGGLVGTNQFLLNGAPISLTGAWQLAPSVEAVQELRVMSNTYDAEFGRTGGGTVSITMRSGGNAWHAMAYEYLHNAVFDANSSENNTIGAGRGKHITHEFGGTVGGPVRKDKDFLFFSFDGYREIAPYPVVADTPPLDLRDGAHFSKYGIRIYDPTTSRLCRDGIDTRPGTTCFSTYIRSSFPGNAIPASRMSQVGANILSLYPAPNGAGLTQNYVASGNSGRYGYVQPLARWDHNFSEKDRFYVLFTYQHSTQAQSDNGFPSPADIGTGHSERTDQNYIAEWTHVLSPTAVFDLRASFGRFTGYFPESSCASCLSASTLGIANYPFAPTVQQNAAPRIDLNLASSIIGNTYTWNTQNQIDVAPGMTQIFGRHVVHYGAEFAYSALGAAGPGRANGEFNFTGQWTEQYDFRSKGVLDGNAVADLLLGLPYTGYIDYNDNYYRTWPYYAGYIQDNWKVHPKLTLNLGLRYDVQIPFLERFNRANQGFDFTTVNPASAQIIANWNQIKASYDADNPQYPYPSPPAAIYGGRTFVSSKNRRPYDTDWTDIQPRVGVAWNFTPKTVFRAGAGIFYRTATQLNSTDGFSQATPYTASIDGLQHPASGSSLSGPYSLMDPYPNGIVQPTRAGLGLLTNIGNTIAFDSRSRPIPRTYEYSGGVQRELPWKMFLDAAYAGSITVHDSFPVESDAVSASLFNQGQANPYLLDRQVPSPFYNILPANTTLGSGPTVSAYDLLRAYPVFNGIGQTNSPMARYRYDSLQLQLEKRVLDTDAGIFSFIFSYTFSKSFEASHRLNDWNLQEKPIHELSAQDKPQNIAFAGTWELPIGWGRRWANDVPRLAGALVNGWAFDWVLTYSSGYPVDKPDALFSCGSYVAPSGQTSAEWFNNDPKCYQSRPLYTLRTTEDRFSNIRTPAAPQLNVSVEKTFWLGERTLLQFRGEAYNATNSPIFPGPDTNYKDPRFGQLPLQQSNFPRYIQIAAKLVF
jgi:hypothetical protein